MFQRLDVLLVPSTGIDATPRVIPEALSAEYRHCVSLRRHPGVAPAKAAACLHHRRPRRTRPDATRVDTNAAPLQVLRSEARAIYERRFTLTRYLEAIGSVLESAGARCSSTRRTNPSRAWMFLSCTSSGIDATPRADPGSAFGRSTRHLRIAAAASRSCSAKAAACLHHPPTPPHSPEHYAS